MPAKTPKPAGARKPAPPPKQAERPSLARLLASEPMQEELKAIVSSKAFNMAHALLLKRFTATDHDIAAMPSETLARKAAAHSALERFPEFLISLIERGKAQADPQPWEHLNPTTDL